MFADRSYWSHCFSCEIELRKDAIILTREPRTPFHNALWWLTEAVGTGWNTGLPFSRPTSRWSTLAHGNIARLVKQVAELHRSNRSPPLFKVHHTGSESGHSGPAASAGPYGSSRQWEERRLGKSPEKSGRGQRQQERCGGAQDGFRDDEAMIHMGNDIRKHLHVKDGTSGYLIQRPIEEMQSGGSQEGEHCCIGCGTPGADAWSNIFAGRRHALCLLLCLPLSLTQASTC